MAVAVVLINIIHWHLFWFACSVCVPVHIFTDHCINLWLSTRILKIIYKFVNTWDVHTKNMGKRFINMQIKLIDVVGSMFFQTRLWFWHETWVWHNPFLSIPPFWVGLTLVWLKVKASSKQSIKTDYNRQIFSELHSLFFIMAWVQTWNLI